MSRNNTIVPIESKILVWARNRINMSLHEVADKLDKDIKTIENWEQGLELPTLAQLEKLSYSIYKVPLAVFFMPEPPEEPSIDRQFRTIPEQEITLLPSKLMLKIKEGQYLQEVLKDLFNGRNPSIEPIFKKLKTFNQKTIFKTAESIRKELVINKGIQIRFKDSTEAFKYYRNQIEKAGIFVFQQTLKDFCRGYSLYDDQFPVIVINSSENSDTGKNFTLFHELSHLLLNMGGLTNDYTYQSDNSEEILCNKLAANILVNDLELQKYEIVYENSSLEWEEKTLSILAKEHKVSQEVIPRKLLDLGLTSRSFYNTKRHEWQSQTYPKRKGSGNFYRNKLSKLGNYYTSIILSNLYTGRINSYQASEYLGLKINQIPQIEKLVFK